MNNTFNKHFKTGSEFREELALRRSCFLRILHIVSLLQRVHVWYVLCVGGVALFCVGNEHSLQIKTKKIDKINFHFESTSKWMNEWINVDFTTQTTAVLVMKVLNNGLCPVNTVKKFEHWLPFSLWKHTLEKRGDQYPWLLSVDWCYSLNEKTLKAIFQKDMSRIIFLLANPSLIQKLSSNWLIF